MSIYCELLDGDWVHKRVLLIKRITSGGQTHVPSVTDCTSCSSNATSSPNLQSGRLEPSNLTTWVKLLLAHDILVESKLFSDNWAHNLLECILEHEECHTQQFVSDQIYWIYGHERLLTVLANAQFRILGSKSKLGPVSSKIFTQKKDF